uniref:cytochrome-c oxidase n=1 Tax=Opisthioglyphe ranae TaxID=99720 RepID=A0AA50DEI4_9TREM|nr:cytochrome c oxidase subunit II [Opisthioglyphe ranae]
MLFSNTVYLNVLVYMAFLCSFIVVWVFVVLAFQLSRWNDMCVLDNENNWVEFNWTVFPTASVTILCMLNLACMGNVPWSMYSDVIKVTGCQWYWTYEIDNENGSYDSVMTDFLTSVDKPLRVIVNVPHLLLVTSSDVIHSFALPYFNVKLDAIPGRLNQTILWTDRVGVFIGYCSELCGAGHAFMPIVMEVVREGSQARGC